MKINSTTTKINALTFEARRDYIGLGNIKPFSSEKSLNLDSQLVIDN